LIVLEIRKRTTDIGGKGVDPLPSVVRHLSSDPKRPVLLQTHPGALRSSGAHDWYACQITDDGGQTTDVICRPSSDVRHPIPDALPLHDVKLVGS